MRSPWAPPLTTVTAPVPCPSCGKEVRYKQNRKGLVFCPLCHHSFYIISCHHCRRQWNSKAVHLKHRTFLGVTVKLCPFCGSMRHSKRILKPWPREEPATAEDLERLFTAEIDWDRIGARSRTRTRRARP